MSDFNYSESESESENEVEKRILRNAEFYGERWCRRVHLASINENQQLKNELELLNHVPYDELIKTLSNRIETLEQELATIKYGPGSQTYERARKHFKQVRKQLRTIKPHPHWTSSS